MNIREKKHRVLQENLQSILAPLDENPRQSLHHTVSYSGMRFEFNLNRQRAGSGYLLRGSVRALDNCGKTIQTVGADGKKAYARCDLNLSCPQKDVSMSCHAAMRIAERIVALFQLYSPLLGDGRLKTDNPLSLSLAQLLLHFGPAYRDHNPRRLSSFQQQLNTLEHLSLALLDTPLRRLTRKVLTDALPEDVSAQTRLKYLRALDEFLLFVQVRTNRADALVPCLTGMIAELSKEKKTTISKQKLKNAANARHLPGEIEERLNRDLEENLLKGPRFLAVALIKGGGLDGKDLLSLRVGDILRDQSNPRIVFVRLRREYAGSATQDYTFPLFPYEAVLVNSYLDALGRQNPERVHSERFLLSGDDDGLKPMERKGFAAFVRNLLQPYRIGYAGLLGNMDLSKKHGIDVLKCTYQHRLEEYSALTPQSDRDAYTFLLHRSLAGHVQGDHYRSFTDEQGRARLLGLVLRDQRFFPAEKGLRQVLNHREGNFDVISCRNKDVNQDLAVTLTFTASDDAVARFRAPYGAIFQVEEVLEEQNGD